MANNTDDWNMKWRTSWQDNWALAMYLTRKYKGRPTEELKVLPNLNANWVKADMEQVFQTTILPTKKQEEQQEHLDRGSSAIDDE